MAAKVKGRVKMLLTAGTATPAAPVGPSLGQHGVNLMNFVKSFNDKTASQKGDLVAVMVTVYEDKTFSFTTKLKPASMMIKEALGLKSASKEPNKVKVGTLTDTQVTELAKKKMQDLNANDLEAAKKIIRGTARSMGIESE